MLKDKYPRVYEHLSKRLESNWETTIELLEKGQREHVLRDFSIPVFKTIYESTLEHFFERDVLKANHISYPDALREVVDKKTGSDLRLTANLIRFFNLKHSFSTAHSCV